MDISDGATDGCCSENDRLWGALPCGKVPGCMRGTREAGSFVRRGAEAAAIPLSLLFTLCAQKPTNTSNYTPGILRFEAMHVDRYKRKHRGDEQVIRTVYSSCMRVSTMNVSYICTCRVPGSLAAVRMTGQCVGHEAVSVCHRKLEKGAQCVVKISSLEALLDSSLCPGLWK